MKTPLHVALADASASHRKKSRAEFQKLNLSEGQPKVLSCLLKREGIVQKELALLCYVEPATMTTLLQKMYAEGLIYKESVIISGGKRAYGIYLTDSGRTRAREVNDVIDRMEQLALDGFSQEEKDTLLALLERVTQNIQEGQI